MTGGPARGLYQTRGGTQVTFLVGVQNRHQRNFRDIQTLTQKIDAHQDVKFTLAKRPENFDPLDNIDIAVEIGPGAVLSGLIKRSCPGVQTAQISSAADLAL